MTFKSLLTLSSIVIQKNLHKYNIRFCLEIRELAKQLNQEHLLWAVDEFLGHKFAAFLNYFSEWWTESYLKDPDINELVGLEDYPDIIQDYPDMTEEEMETVLSLNLNIQKERLLLFIKVWADYRKDERMKSLNRLYEKLDKSVNRRKDKVIVFAFSGPESSDLYFYDPEVKIELKLRSFKYFFSQVLFHVSHQFPLTFPWNAIFAQQTTRFIYMYIQEKKFVSSTSNLVPGASFTAMLLTTLLRWSYFTTRFTALEATVISAFMHLI